MLMKKLNHNEILQKAKQELRKKMRVRASYSRQSAPNGAPADPVDYALWSIGRHAKTKATRMIISGKSKKLLPEINQLDDHLRELEISHTEISDLSTLVMLPSLENLKISATKIVDWSVLASLKKLQRLEISFCGDACVSVPDLPELVELKVLNTRGDISLGDLPKLEKAEFQVLGDLAEVSKQPELAELKFEKIGNQSLEALAELVNLRQLNARLHGEIDLQPLASQTGLKNLRLVAPDVTNIEAISVLSSLETLELFDLSVTDASALKGLTKLRSLSLHFKTQLADCSFLSEMKNLSRLGFSPTADADLHPLTELPNLQKIGLFQISPKTKLSPLTECKELQQLSIAIGEKNDGPLAGPLPSPPRLKTLSLSGRAVDSLAGLELCRDLQYLHCNRTSVDSLEPLRGLPKLAQIHVPGSNVSDLSVIGSMPYFRAEHSSIVLGVEDTPAIKRYPKIEQSLGGNALERHEYGQHRVAIEVVRETARGT